MELFGIGFGVLAAVQAVSWTLVTVLFPVFWLWMLVDAVLRDPSEYPGGGENAKLVWILLLVLVQLVAVPYLVMVYGKIRRTPAAMKAQQPAPGSPAPTAGG